MRNDPIPAVPMAPRGLNARPTLARIQRAVNQVRAECSACGSHAYVTPGIPRSNKCGNCGSFDLRRLAS